MNANPASFRRPSSNVDDSQDRAPRVSSGTFQSSPPSKTSISNYEERRSSSRSASKKSVCSSVSRHSQSSTHIGQDKTRLGPSFDGTVRDLPSLIGQGRPREDDADTDTSKGSEGSATFRRPSSNDAEASAKRAMAHHGIGEDYESETRPSAWEPFDRQQAAMWSTTLEIQNHFYAGYSHRELDWTRPVHGILIDFKGDGMQMGMVIRRLMQQGEQFVFIGQLNGVNTGGWYFTSVNDFERPREQAKLDPDWTNIRIWHQVNYVPSLTAGGLVALTPSEDYDSNNKHSGAIPVREGFMLSSIICVGGLMAGILVSDLGGASSLVNNLIELHIEYGVTLATIGHGLDVMVGCGTGCGTRVESAIKGFVAALTPDQKNLIKTSGIRSSPNTVFEYNHTNGTTLISASVWGSTEADVWFRALGLSELVSPRGDSDIDNLRKPCHILSRERVHHLDFSKSMAGGWNAYRGRPRVAILVDTKMDPVQAYTAITQLMRKDINFQFIGRSTELPEGADKDNTNMVIRPVLSEIVFGEPVFGDTDLKISRMPSRAARCDLRNCCLSVPATPANLVADMKFDGFAIVGGQGAYHMIGDPAIINLLNDTSIGAAAGHGPIVLIGSKWIRADEVVGPQFTASKGSWVYFRDLLKKQTNCRIFAKNPLNVCSDEIAGLYTSTLPSSATEWMEQFSKAVLKDSGALEESRSSLDLVWSLGVLSKRDAAARHKLNSNSDFADAAGPSAGKEQERKSDLISISWNLQELQSINWSFDDSGASIRKIKDSAPDGHSLAVGDRLLKINCHLVSHKSREVINAVWTAGLAGGQTVLELEFSTVRAAK